MARKVLLIDPGQKFAENGSRHSVRQTPHIGLCYLATVLRDIADVKVLDMPLLRLGEEDLLEEYAKLDSGDIVGITAATFNVPEALRAAEMAKAHNSDFLVVMGGPHVNAFPTDVLERCEHVDAAVAGEGEKILTEIVNNYDQPGFSWDIPGVAWRNSGELTYRPVTNDWVVQDLDEIPLPDWEFLELDRYSKRYSSHFDRMEQVAPLSTNRGCPYQCSFCDGANLTNKLKWRSAQNTIDEIQNGLERHNLRHYYITDSVMCIPKWRFLEFCDLMIATGLNKEVSMIGQAQINSIDEEIVTKYSEAGGEYIFFGLESGNEEVLKKGYIRISQRDEVGEGAVVPGMGARLECAEPLRNLLRDVYVSDGKEDHIVECVECAESAGSVLDDLDDSVEAFGDGVGKTRVHECEDAEEVLSQGPDELSQGFKSTSECGRRPAFQEAFGSPGRFVFPELLELVLESPGSIDSVVRLLQCFECPSIPSGACR